MVAYLFTDDHDPIEAVSDDHAPLAEAKVLSHCLSYLGIDFDDWEERADITDCQLATIGTLDLGHLLKQQIVPNKLWLRPETLHFWHNRFQGEGLYYKPTLKFQPRSFYADFHICNEHDLDDIINVFDLIPQSVNQPLPYSLSPNQLYQLGATNHGKT